MIKKILLATILASAAVFSIAEKSLSQVDYRLHPYTPVVEGSEKEILAQGELVSTRLFHYYLESIDVSNELVSALDFMRIDRNGEPQGDRIRQDLRKILKSFICFLQLSIKCFQSNKYTFHVQ